MTNSGGFNDRYDDVIGRTRRGGLKRKGSFLTRQREKLRLQKEKTRIQKLLDSLAINMNARYYMNELLESLETSDLTHKSEVISYPELENTYTFIYEAKTPGLLYDYHPLSKILYYTDNGFVGYNFHLQQVRQYTSDGRVRSKFYKVYDDELSDVLKVPSEYLRVVPT